MASRATRDSDLQNAFSKGDGINFSIAAASIIAKTHRDRLMEELEEKYPGYGFTRHKGFRSAERFLERRRHQLLDRRRIDHREDASRPADGRAGRKISRLWLHAPQGIPICRTLSRKATASTSRSPPHRSSRRRIATG